MYIREHCASGFIRTNIAETSADSSTKGFRALVGKFENSFGITPSAGACLIVCCDGSEDREGRYQRQIFLPIAKEIPRINGHNRVGGSLAGVGRRADQDGLAMENKSSKRRIILGKIFLDLLRL
jgi:hypothetical protein